MFGRALVIFAVMAMSAEVAAAQVARLDHAWDALQRGDAQKAVALVSSAVASGALAFEETGAAYNMRGMAYMKLEDFANAEADFDVAVSLVPGFAAALTNRGLARAKLERYAEAIDDFDAALAAAPGEPEVLFMRGNARFDSRDFDGAVADYAAALKVVPDHWMALMNRCDALGKLGRIKEARADCAMAKALAPDASVVASVENALGPCDCDRDSERSTQ